MQNLKLFGISPAQRSYSAPSGSKFVPVVSVHFVLTECLMSNLWGVYMLALLNTSPYVTPKRKTSESYVGSHGSRFNCWRSSRETKGCDCHSLLTQTLGLSIISCPAEQTIDCTRGSSKTRGRPTANYCKWGYRCDVCKASSENRSFSRPRV
jgi:hypothetical protein